MEEKQLAEEILKNVGGKENVNSLVHCATRLRFKLNDLSQADKESLRQNEKILSVVESGGQFQVVIGSSVDKVYEEIKKHGVSTESSASSSSETTLVSRIFEIISGSFSPLIPALAGSGMIKALLTILTLTGTLSEESGTYALLSAASNAIFYFLPIFLGITISIQFRANAYVGGVIGAALFEPAYTSLMESSEQTGFLGIPVILADYSTSVFPIFIAIAMYAIVEKLLKRVIMKDLQLFLVPMLALMIMLPLTVILFGPFGTYVGGGISSGAWWLIETSGFVAGILLGGLQAFLVVFGLHWGITPITLDNLATRGGDPIEALFACSVFAQMGIAAGVFIRAKKRKELRALAGSTSLTGLLSGVTEPILYGIILRYKRVIPLLIIAGGAGGIINGTSGTQMTAYVFHNIFSIPAYSPMFTHILSVTVSFATAAILVVVFGFESKKKIEKEEQDKETIADSSSASIKQEQVLTPVSGTVMEISDVEDTVFASGTMGPGLAVVPSENELIAPFDGTVSAVFPTKHAIGITSSKGTEILMHIGLNTVQLNGEHFTSFFKEGDVVRQGDTLLSFDRDAIQAKGYQITTPIIVTNGDEEQEIYETTQMEVKAGEPFFAIVR
ncbi:PTS system beta-glucosides-specific IIC component [Salibacterium salarium]|uniref:beta-glucoside-specific PTS transporter subunit IIABC n=1 Tax=Salibacterium salarium TaxID=284579 RepID=UPI00277D268D|nr:beta-glucoside-specific PTS transporter subunit IIABC [Salibacterium salarium]MDQ0297914.1 PTS system beta-glucosides-specific IIC component [Salibacterium salarium]